MSHDQTSEPQKKLLLLSFAAMFLKLLLVWALLFNLASSSYTEFIFNNGFRGAKLSLDGQAAISPDGLLQLTENTSNEKGQAFYPNPIQFRQSPNNNVSSFSSTFVFAIVPEILNTGSSGGFTFAISPSKDFSSSMSGQFLGLFNSNNDFKPNNHIIAVEFDTSANPDFSDIDNNHVGIDVNGLNSSISHPAGYCSGNSFVNLTLISGQPMQVWIEYDGVANELNVTLSPLKVPKPSIPLLQYTIDLSGIILEDYLYAGFTASTSENDLSYCILAWSFKIDGEAQELDLSNLPKLPQSQLPGSSSKLDILAVWLPLVIVVSLLACSVAVFLILRRRNKYAELLEDWEQEFGPHRFSYKDLFRATKGFKDKYLLGAGGFGKVYKGVLPVSEIEVAVKRISHESQQGVREFVAEIASLGRLRHRNLVQLLGYCRRKGELLLVYDFMPNGSLDTFLFKDVKVTLSWPQRFQIIKGVASGLLYLHEDWEQVVIHRDVKGSNVLLDREMNGRLGDFGLARLYDHGSDPQTTLVIGTMGYLAPELAQTGKATTATDVFAFGAFLLEVACGRRPIELEKSCEETILVDWVLLHLQRGAILETVDAKLGEECAVEEVELVLKLGLLCSNPVAAMRPSMRQVTQFLDGDAQLPEVTPDRISDSIAMIGTGGFSDCILSYPSSSCSGSDLSSTWRKMIEKS